MTPENVVVVTQEDEEINTLGHAMRKYFVVHHHYRATDLAKVLGDPRENSHVVCEKDVDIAHWIARS